MQTARTPGIGTRVLWWSLTVLFLVILDDLTFGPVFWAVSRTAGAVVATVTVFLVYLPAHIFFVWQGTSESPGRVARWFLSRYDLERRPGRIAANEASLRGRVVGAGSALGLTLLIGGTLPPLILWRQGYSQAFVRRLSVATAAVYAAEFALLHAVLPSLI